MLFEHMEWVEREEQIRPMSYFKQPVKSYPQSSTPFQWHTVGTFFFFFWHILWVKWDYQGWTSMNRPPSLFTDSREILWQDIIYTFDNLFTAELPVLVRQRWVYCWSNLAVWLHFFFIFFFTYLIDEKLQLDDGSAALVLTVTLHTWTTKPEGLSVKERVVANHRIHHTDWTKYGARGKVPQHFKVICSSLQPISKGHDIC